MTDIPGLGPKKAMVLYEELRHLLGGRSGRRPRRRAAGGPARLRAEDGGEHPARHRADPRRRRAGADRRRDGRGRGDRGRAVRRVRLPSRAPTPVRCGGCGRPSATSTSSPPPDDPARSWTRSPGCPVVAEVIVQRRQEDVGAHQHRRAAGRPAGGAARSRGARRCSTSPGPRPHNIRIREIAVRKGLKLSEYGLFRVDEWRAGRLRDRGGRVRSGSGLPWIPPTLREDRGEVDAALAGTLPDAGHHRRHPGRPAHPHQPHRRRGLAGGDAGRGRGRVA